VIRLRDVQCDTTAFFQKHYSGTTTCIQYVNGKDNMLICTFAEDSDVGMTVTEEIFSHQCNSLFKVTQVQAEGIAYKAGVRVGFYVIGVKGKDYMSFSDLNQSLNGVEPCEVIFKCVSNAAEERQYKLQIVVYHMRSIYLLLFHLKGGYPCFRQYKLFRYDYVNNFGLFTLLCAIWIFICIIQIIWLYSGWVIFTVGKFLYDVCMWTISTMFFGEPSLQDSTDSRRSLVQRVTLRNSIHYADMFFISVHCYACL
jgi:hypothetical protein